jgi:ElaB/YqjD/DUF883 family membrane-anchored ribosome-binding protein
MDDFKLNPMNSDKQIEAILDEINQRRAKLATSLIRLGKRVEIVTHWRRWIQAHPLASLAAAASLGILFGLGHHLSHRRNK